VTRRRVVWLVLGGAALAVAVVATLALVNLSALARQAALWQLEARTGRAAQLEALELSLFDGRLALRGLRVVDHDGGPLIEIGRLEGRFDPWALLRAAVQVQDLALTDVHVRIVRTEAGHLNVADLLAGPPSSSPTVGAAVDRLTLSGRVTFEDRALQPARTWDAEVRVDAHELTTHGRRGRATASVDVAGALVTVRVDDWQLAPAHLRALVNVRDLDLRLATLYLPADGPVALQRGTLSAGLAIVVDAAEGIRLDADAVVEDFALRRPAAVGDTVAAPHLEILVRELHHRPGALTLRYASAGGDLTVLEPTQTPPRALTFTDFTFTASALEQPMTGPARIALHANVPGGGELDASGTVGVLPHRADVRVRARGLELAVLARYLPLEAGVSGTATADVRVVAAHDGLLTLAVTGDAVLDRIQLADGSRTLGSARRIRAAGLEYRWPATLSLGQLTLTQPSMTVERAEDGTLDLGRLLRTPGVASEAVGPVATGLAPELRVAALSVVDGRATLADAASGVRVDVARLRASARDLVWPGPGVAALEAAAVVAGASVSARGSIDVADGRAALDLGVRDADLARLQPWIPIRGRVQGRLSQAAVRVQAQLGEPRTLSVDGSVTLERPSLADGARVVAGATRVSLDGLEYRWPTSVRVAELTVRRPAISVERDAAGDIGLAALMQPVAPAAGEGPPVATSPPPDVRIDRVRVEDGRAAFTDTASGGHVELTRLALTGRDVSWPARGPSRLELTATVADGQVAAQGTIDATRRTGEVRITARGTDLAALQPWLPITGRLRGAAEADVTVLVGLEPFSLALQGTAAASGLAFLEGTRPLLTIGRVEASGIDLRWPTRLSIARLHAHTPWAQIDRTPEGELSLRAIFRRRPDAPASSAVGGEGAAATLTGGLALSVGDMLFEQGGTSIVDDAVEPAARFEVRGTRLALRNLTWPAQTPAQVQLSTPMPGTGVLKAQGTFSIEPTRLRLDVELDQVDLAPARSYLPIDARLSGRVTGRARVDGTFDDTIRLVVEGDTTVERLALGDADRRLATARHATLAGVRYRYPGDVRVREVTLRRPWALVEREADGQLAIVTLLARPRPGTPPSPGPPPVTAPPLAAGSVRVAVDRLTLEDGFLRFVDRTTEPHYAEEVSGVVLTAEGLGTDPRRHGSVDLRGTFASGTPLTVSGRISSFTGPRFLDLTVGVKDFPVPRLNPYLDRLSSWIARQGVLTASLRYKLDGEEIEADNQVHLQGLELEQGGRGNEVQRRIGLPLGTLVSLLKNRQGEIQLSIPVRGQLSSPDFHYGDAVWTALRGLAIKLVSLPFSWIGQMLYTEDARIESIQVFPVPFQTARAVPTSFGRDQVQRLATFLREQPAIRLRLRPVTTVPDVTALRREALEARLAEAGPDPTARRQAAIALYSELFPRRQLPADDALLEELVRQTPPAPRALRTLAADRTALIRDALVADGIAAERLEPAESRTAVEGEGDPRVEFEIVR
jgi:hypothetical protein